MVGRCIFNWKSPFLGWEFVRFRGCNCVFADEGTIYTVFLNKAEQWTLPPVHPSPPTAASGFQRPAPHSTDPSPAQQCQQVNQWQLMQPDYEWLVGWNICGSSIWRCIYDGFQLLHWWLSKTRARAPPTIAWHTPPMQCTVWIVVACSIQPMVI